MSQLGLTKLSAKACYSNFFRLRRPYKINFAITYKCNLRCQTCNIWKKKSIDELSAEEIKKFFVENPFFSWISLTGGEPFLRKDLPEIVGYVSDSCRDLYLLNIPSNGSQPKVVEGMVEECLGMDIPKMVVTLSLDGPRELHDRLRGAKGSWQKSIESFQRLFALSGKKRNLEVFFEFTLSSINTGKFNQTFEAVKEEIPSLKPRDIHINLFHNSEHYYCNTEIKGFEKRPLLSELENIQGIKRHFSIKPSKILPQVYMKKAEYYIKNSRTPIPCKALEANCFMDPVGNLYPCSIYSKKLGNIREVNFQLDSLWNTSNALDLRGKIKKLQCPNCWSPCEAYTSLLGNILRWW
ncbi:MAG: radical SAM protein [Candidatus Altiarchaeota archaeon]